MPHILDGQRPGRVGWLRQVAARWRRLLPRAATVSHPIVFDQRLSVGDAAKEGWKAFGEGRPVAACPYLDRQAQDAWRSAWRSAQQFDRVFR